jgi:2,3-bisphosphoglycerate-independent phosphoglycerate mutase
MSKQTSILCILDGFGLIKNYQNNAIAQAKLPNIQHLFQTYPWTLGQADGQFVGLEEGLVGNSEVGHMNLGGLKLIPQLNYQITKTAEIDFDLDKSLAPDQNFDPKDFIKDHLKAGKNSTAHLIGLFSKGTVHADLRHWAGAIRATNASGIDKIILHIISDGRDVDRQSLVSTWEYFVDTYLKAVDGLEEKVSLGSLGGRYYAMDRDKNWDRVETGLESILHASENTDNVEGYQNIRNFLEKQTTKNYSEQNFDETIMPISTGKALLAGDLIWLINFRTDRFRQLVKMISDLNKDLSLNFSILSMNDYGDGRAKKGVSKDFEFDDVDGYYPVFETKPVQGTLSEAICQLGAKQLHIAETEKYNHVTYFLNGGQDKKAKGEDWQVIPSHKVKSHAEKPEMRAKEVMDYIVDCLNGVNDPYDAIIVNFANPDMVGHTGDLEAGVKSMEALDEQIGRLIPFIESGQVSLILTADHGNIEIVGELEDQPGRVDTEHNANPVPVLLAGGQFETLFSSAERLGFEIDGLDVQLAKKEESKQLHKQEWWLQSFDFPAKGLPLWVVGVLFLSLVSLTSSNENKA